jgi:phosphoribosylamine--glycine ligase
VKVLVIGNGAREHALGWKLAASPRVDEVMSLPGNPGLAQLGPVVEGISASDVGAVAAMARLQRIDLVVVGPEVPLAAGVVDAVQRLSIPVFGPTRAAARLESSKGFAKEVMRRAGVATAASETFTDLGGVVEHLAGKDGPYVVKADGLAAGKGVLVTDDRDEASAWAGRWLPEGPVVVEEFLDGPEVSVFAVCTEKGAVPLEPARDYKRLRDGDQGPNTGGMGSYSPVDHLPGDLVETTMAEVISPTQAILPRMETDLLDVLEGARPESSGRATVNVVLAAEGYPEAPVQGAAINGLDTVPEDVLVFHAGTRREGKRLLVDGGRVLSIVGSGDSLAQARERAYAAADTVRWPGMQHRTDIGL